ACGNMVLAIYLLLVVPFTRWVNGTTSNKQGKAFHPPASCRLPTGAIPQDPLSCRSYIRCPFCGESAMTILVLGDANADLSAAIPRFPAEGDDSLISALGWGSGGCAANVAAALALLGAPARLLACVGSDPAAAIALRVARAAGADLAAVQADDALATGLCFAAVSPGGERTFFCYCGAHDNFCFWSVRATELHQVASPASSCYA